MNIVIATGWTVGLAEWIIDGTHVETYSCTYRWLSFVVYSFLDSNIRNKEEGNACEKVDEEEENGFPNRKGFKQAWNSAA